MPLLPAAILAQVLTAGIGDRVEVRSVIQSDERRLEGENLAYATVALELPALTVRAVYSPSMLLTPLEEKPRDFSVTHTLTGAADSTLTLYESARHEASLHLGANYTQQDFRRQLIGATIRVAPDGESTPESTSSLAEATRANGLTTRTAGAVADVRLSHRLSRPSTLEEFASYIVSSGVDSDSRDLYPLTHGPEAAVSFVHAASRRDTLTTTAGAQLLMVPSTDERAWRVGLGEGIEHVFGRRTTGNAALAVVYTRSEEPGTEPIENISPAARLGLNYKTPLAGGQLALGVELSYAPVLDQSALVFDTRVGISGNADWVKDRLTLYATTGTAVSVSPEDPGSLSSASGSVGADYDLGVGFVAHAGVRTAWQTFEDIEELPPTWVTFVALSWNFDWPTEGGSER